MRLQRYKIKLNAVAPRSVLFFNHDANLSYHNLLRLHIIAVDESQNIHPRGHPFGRDVARRVSTNDGTPHHIHNLQRALAVDDNVAVADEGEWRILVAVSVLADGGKHQAETRSVVGGFGGEGVGRDAIHCVSTIGQQVGAVAVYFTTDMRGTPSTAEIRANVESVKL